MKNVLIIPCCARQLLGSHRAIDLYIGSMFKLLKSKLTKPEDTFELLILSAKYGLISSTDVLRDYDVQMPLKSDQVDSYCDTHMRNARKLLNSVSSKNVILSVVLPNDYLFAFDRMFSVKYLKSKFKSCYVSRTSLCTDEQLRGCLSRIIKAETSQATMGEPTLFRSGVANISELGFVAAGCSVGSSLCHTNTEKMTHLLVELLRTTKHGGRFFLDNGLITLLNHGKKINYNWVFEQYHSIIASLTIKAAKNLYLVVPDDVASNDNALQIRDDILALNKFSELILPIHRSDNIVGEQ
ncbi:hypothetical protein VHA01S_074_00090 [Vibrio halioticoli NBRC 102217]|uniref:DUF6884 domain-containing protein n=1 Tax=Vibrio halioticoli NBRC 102217 TaxID=1219072 RepID=V5FHK4_9VIBR|nr:DUF6884 domain-containing protein [Vibrio halioticoli]GAD91218.1 hypothetical protein VHA01S_074_00090 [Vibrio halioticoli NBRC 102217]